MCYIIAAIGGCLFGIVTLAILSIAGKADDMSESYWREKKKNEK